MSNDLDISSYNQAYAVAKTSVAWKPHPVGILRAWGNERLDLLQRMTTNNVSTVKAGEGVQTVFITDKARIIDVATVLERENEGKPDVLMLLSDGMDERIAAWLDKYTFMDDFTIENLTAQCASLLVFGPRSAEFLAQLTGVELPEVQGLRLNHWKTLSVPASGLPVMLVKQPPFCELCYLLLMRKDDESAVLAALRSYGDQAPEIDEHTFETLRIEAGWGKLGAEWTDAHNPLEAGLVSLVDFRKGCYIGQEVIARLDTYNKVKVRLVGFTAAQEIPVGAKFWDETATTASASGAEIGSITSAAYSPELGTFIALGYLRTAFASPGVIMEAVFGDEKLTVEVVKLPFVM